MYVKAVIPHMSAEQQYPMGMHHMTVVPENFDPFDEPQADDNGDNEA